MAKFKDLSPKFKIVSAEQELQLPIGVTEMGQSIGGISAYSRVFKRGYGDNVFGVDENGMWLGGADFDTATIQFYYEGLIIIRDKDTGKRRVRLGKLINV